MKTIYSFILLITLFVCLSSCNYTIETLNEGDFIKPTIENFEYLLKLTSEEFDSEMRKLDFEKDKDTELFSYLKIDEKSIQFVTLLPEDGGLNIFWITYTESNSYIKLIMPYLESKFLSKNNKRDFYEITLNNEPHILTIHILKEEKYKGIKLSEEINIYKENYFSKDFIKEIKN